MRCVVSLCLCTLSLVGADQDKSYYWLIDSQEYERPWLDYLFEEYGSRNGHKTFRSLNEKWRHYLFYNKEHRQWLIDGDEYDSPCCVAFSSDVGDGNDMEGLVWRKHRFPYPSKEKYRLVELTKSYIEVWNDPPKNFRIMKSKSPSDWDQFVGLYELAGWHNKYPNYTRKDGEARIYLDSKQKAWVGENNEGSGKTSIIFSAWQPLAASPASWEEWNEIYAETIKFENETEIQRMEEMDTDQNIYCPSLRIREEIMMDKFLRKGFDLACFNLEGKWKYMDYSDSRICNSVNECISSADEHNCPFYTNPDPAVLLLIVFICIFIGFLIFCILHALKVTKFENEHEIEIDDNLEKTINALICQVMVNNENLGKHEEDLFDQIHVSPEGLAVLVKSGFTLIGNPISKYSLANFITSQENRIHEKFDNKNSVNLTALKCLRKNVGSNAEVISLMDHMQEPNMIKKQRSKINQWFESICFKNRHRKIVMEICKITFGLTAFSFDFTKDIFLFIFLLRRFDEIVVAEFGANVETPVNSQFLIYMIYFHGASIIATQLIMGLYILTNMKTVFHVQNKLKYAFLAFLIPFFPSIIMYKIIHLNAKKRYLISTWRKEHEANGKTKSDQSGGENLQMNPSIKQNEEVEAKMIGNEEMESKGGQNEELELERVDNKEKFPQKGENEDIEQNGKNQEEDLRNRENENIDRIGEYPESDSRNSEYEEIDPRNGVKIWNKCQGIDNEVRSTLEIYSKLRLVEANVESLPQLLLLLTYFGVSTEVEALGLNNDGYFVFLSASFTFAFIIYAIIGAIDIQKKEQLLFLRHKILLGLSYSLQVIGRVSPMVCICLLAILPPFTPYSMNLMDSQMAIALIALPLIVHMLCGLLASKIFVPDLSFFDRVIHVLSGVFVILPFREMKSETQSHKGKEMTVSAIMIVLDILVQLIGIACYGPWTVEPETFPEYDYGGPSLQPQVPLQIINLVPRLVLGLSPLAFFLGILLLILYYRRLHSFAPLTADQYWCRRRHNSANESTAGCGLCSTSILITCHKQGQLDT